MYVLSNAPYFIVLIGALVFFHELGHFLMAKAFNVKVLRFSLGFGPRVFGFVRGETEYTVNLLPLGGYVKMLGEGHEMAANHPDAAHEDDEERVLPEDAGRTLISKPLWQRAIIVLAGPAANLALAWVVYLTMFMGTQAFGDTRLGVVVKGGPAWQAGLRPGDKIVAIQGQATGRWEQLRDLIALHPETDLSVEYTRGQEQAAGVHKAVIHTHARTENDAFAQPTQRGTIGVSMQYVRPSIAIVDAQSPAAKAGLKTGDVIEAIDNDNVVAWHEVVHLLETKTVAKPLAVSVRRLTEHVVVTLVPTAFPKDLAEAPQSSADLASAYTGLVAQDVVVASVEPHTAAAKAGIEPGDRLWSIRQGSAQEQLIGVWEFNLADFNGEAEDDLSIVVQRQDRLYRFPLATPRQKSEDQLSGAERTFVFGAHNEPNCLDAYSFERFIYPVEAGAEALKQLGEDISLIGRGIGKMVKGDIPMSSMGGPIMLFVIAEKSAKRGYQAFGRALAMTSVNLGVLNVLPVPVLDGGHLLFFAIEGVTRRPPSARVREWANMVGLGLLLLLMVLVFRNDVMRFLLAAK